MNPMASMPALSAPALPAAAQVGALTADGATAPSRFADMLGDARAAEARAVDARAADPCTPEARENGARESGAGQTDAGEAETAAKPCDDQAPGKSRGTARGHAKTREADAATRAHARAAPTAADVSACGEGSAAADAPRADSACPADGAKNEPPALDELLPGWVTQTTNVTRAAAPAIDTAPQVPADALDADASDTAKAALAAAASDTLSPRRRGPIDRADAPATAAAPDAASQPTANADVPRAWTGRKDSLDDALQGKPHPAAGDAFARAAEGERVTPTLPGAAPVAATPPGLSGAASAPAATPPMHSHVSPPIDSPSFAPALATQVRWLVREGVSQAQIQLNPAEMGPVSVRIMLEGREVRVDFGADAAATRQVLEASLPVLAAAFDDSGLTLTGSSVRDGQSGSPPSHERQSPRGHGATPTTDAPSAGTDALPAAARPMAARGLVDLVA